MTLSGGMDPTESVSPSGLGTDRKTAGCELKRGLSKQRVIIQFGLSADGFRHWPVSEPDGNGEEKSNLKTKKTKKQNNKKLTFFFINYLI